jgi:hypothetical protein
MKNVLVLDNYDSFVYNLVYLLKELGAHVDVFRNDKISLEEVGKYDQILLSPGPGIPSEAGIMMDLLKVCLSLVADEYQIAGKHIVTPGSQLSLVRLKAKTIEEFNSSGLVSPQLGEEGTLKLFSFLKGDLKLQINNGKVELI